MYMSVRFPLLQVPQYEEDSVFVQSLSRRQSVAHNVPGFDTEMNHQDPSFSLGVLCVVVGMCAGLVFMVVDGCVSKFQPFQPSSHKIVSHREPLNWYFGVSRRMLFLVCGMVWIIKDPFFRPTFVSSTLVAATHALEAATIAALVLGCSRRACSSICQDLMLLHSIGGLADKFEDVLVDTFEL
ncbi:hypothetical protein CARUB_v10027214mg [Capsella rubella]|uniref:Transmembrane protein n=1 Tax=Capsella rubella TaxID=81985 RepID=R0EXU4_9BRAS|nr:hypothetical protein CARUB_v10027214mg [Capsella rubella]